MWNLYLFLTLAISSISRKDLYVGSMVLTFASSPESPMGMLTSILWDFTSDSVGPGICTSSKLSGDAAAASQEINFVNDCVRFWRFLKNHLVEVLHSTDSSPLSSFPGQTSLLNPSPLNSWVLTHLRSLQYHSLVGLVPESVPCTAILASPGVWQRCGISSPTPEYPFNKILDHLYTQ